eukprot:c18900_g2_i1 orf=178-627(+)
MHAVTRLHLTLDSRSWSIHFVWNQRTETMKCKWSCSTIEFVKFQSGIQLSPKTVESTNCCTNLARNTACFSFCSRSSAESDTSELLSLQCCNVDVVFLEVSSLQVFNLAGSSPSTIGRLYMRAERKESALLLDDVLLLRKPPPPRRTCK